MMNFKEFNEHVQEMHMKINDEGINPAKVEIIHTKSTGENILAAIYGENIIDYFKW